MSLDSSIGSFQSAKGLAWEDLVGVALQEAKFQEASLAAAAYQAAFPAEVAEGQAEVAEVAEGQATRIWATILAATATAEVFWTDS